MRAPCGLAKFLGLSRAVSLRAWTGSASDEAARDMRDLASQSEKKCLNALERETGMADDGYSLIWDI